LLTASDIVKEFPTPAGALRILNGLNLKLPTGEAASIMGPSGSGKSTLLSILGALEPPTSGTMTLDGENPFHLHPDQLASFRNQKVGFVFQDHCLLPQCTVLENVLIPSLVAPRGDHRKRARELVEQVGLADRLHHLPSQLSGGEKQRVAIARALVLSPHLVLCDEPTGNLDRRTAETVTRLLLDLHARHHMILILVTHSEVLAQSVPIRYELAEGRLVER